jgi:hypothetical protein
MKISAVFAVFAISTAAIAADYANYNSGQPGPANYSYAVEGAEGAPTALLYNDRPLGITAGMELAAQALGYNYTYVGDSAGFSGLLGAGGWDLVISGHHNQGGPQPWEAGLASYIAGGGAAVSEDWRVGFGSDGVTSSAPTNYPSATPTAGSRFAGTFGSSAIPLGNTVTGWGVFNTTLTGGTGAQQLTSAFGGAAGKKGDSGNSFVSGLNDDTIGGPGIFDAALATDVYSAMILNVPEPTTIGLLGLGALGVLRRRR